MTESGSTWMAREVAESSETVARIAGKRRLFAALARQLDLSAVPLAVLCGRGSSGHAGVSLRYLIETRLQLPVSIR